MSTNPYTELDRIIAALVPAHASTKRPAPLDDDTPAQMRLLWEAIGYSDATNLALGVGLRSLAESEAELDRIFAIWRASPKSRAFWSADADPGAFRAALPPKVRVVKTNKDLEIAFTDESRGEADPPVLVMKSAGPRVFVWHERYTEWLIWRLLENLTAWRSTGYSRLADLPAQQVLGDVYPQMYRLAERIWWMSMPAFSRKDQAPMVSRPIFYASLDDYLAFVAAQPVDKIVHMRTPPMATVELRPSGPLDLYESVPEGFRIFVTIGFKGLPEKGRNAIGKIDGTFVWLGQLPDGDLSIKFNPRNRDEVMTWLAGLKLKPSDETPMRPGYDKYGW